MLHTHTSADQIELRTPTALNIVRLGVPEDGLPRAGGDAQGFTDDEDPEWVDPGTLVADMNRWYKALFHYKATASEDSGIVLLSNQELVTNTIPLMDSSCPTAALTMVLRKKGWKGVERRCEHTSVVPGVFDSYAAIKMKTYYQALLRIDKCLPLTSVLPSREPIRYYRLLLSGRPAEPGQGAKAYLAITNEARVEQGADLEALGNIEDEDPAAGLADGSEHGESDEDDVGIPLVPVVPKPKRRKGPPAPPVGGGSGGASGSGDVVAPPGPVVPPAPVPPSPSGSSSSDKPIRCPIVDVDGRPIEVPQVPDDDAVVGIDSVVRAAVPPRIVREEKPEWEDSIDGYMIRYDPAYTTPGGVVFFTESVDSL